MSAFKYDQGEFSFSLHEKLTMDHFDLDPASKMRNHLADEVLDENMLNLMKVVSDIEAFHQIYIIYIVCNTNNNSPYRRYTARMFKNFDCPPSCTAPKAMRHTFCIILPSFSYNQVFHGVVLAI